VASTYSPLSQSIGSTSSSLIERVRSHDQDAWRRLVRLYGPLVAHWLKRAGLQSADAADVLQDVFQAVAQGIGKFHKDQPGGTFRGWLRGITRFKIADHFRRRGVEPAGAGGSDAARWLEQVPDVEDDSSGDDEDALRQLRLRAFELVEAEFEPQTWRLFWGMAAEGRSAQEVAERFGATAAAVRMAKSRVMRRLRQEFEGLTAEA